MHCPVTAPEFTQAIEQLGLSLSLSRDTAAVANMAADGAGTIAIDEFITAVWERKCTRLRGVFAAATKNAWRGEAPQSLSVCPLDLSTCLTLCGAGVASVDRDEEKGSLASGMG